MFSDDAIAWQFFVLFLFYTVLTTGYAVISTFFWHDLNFDSAEVVYGRRGERSRGYGTIMFFSPEEAQMAIEQMNGYSIDGRNIMCKIDRCA